MDKIFIQNLTKSSETSQIPRPFVGSPSNLSILMIRCFKCLKMLWNALK